MSEKTLGERIAHHMKLQGYTSVSSRHGVDVRSLANASGKSYEMARRYLDNIAVPRDDVLKKVASWLKTTDWELKYGNENFTPSQWSDDGTQAVNRELLSDILTILRDVIEAKELNYPKSLYTDWVFEIHDELVKRWPHYKSKDHKGADIYDFITKTA